MAKARWLSQTEVENDVAHSFAACGSAHTDLGGFIQFAQLQKRASEAGAGAGRRVAGETALPTGTDTLGITRCEREGGSLVQKCG